MGSFPLALVIVQREGFGALFRSAKRFWNNSDSETMIVYIAHKIARQMLISRWGEGRDKICKYVFDILTRNRTGYVMYSLSHILKGSIRSVRQAKISQYGSHSNFSIMTPGVPSRVRYQKNNEQEVRSLSYVLDQWEGFSHVCVVLISFHFPLQSSEFYRPFGLVFG